MVGSPRVNSDLDGHISLTSLLCNKVVRTQIIGDWIYFFPITWEICVYIYTYIFWKNGFFFEQILARADGGDLAPQ